MNLIHIRQRHWYDLSQLLGAPATLTVRRDVRVPPPREQIKWCSPFKQETRVTELASMTLWCDVMWETYFHSHLLINTLRRERKKKRLHGPRWFTISTSSTSMDGRSWRLQVRKDRGQDRELLGCTWHRLSSQRSTLFQSNIWLRHRACQEAPVWATDPWVWRLITY